MERERERESETRSHRMALTLSANNDKLEWYSVESIPPPKPMM